MRTVLLFSMMSVTLATLAVAQIDPITERKNLMKSNGAALRAATQMAKGEIPFDLGKAKQIFKTFHDVGTKFPTLFPENSRTGGDTAASAKIWEDMQGFRAAAAKLAADAEKAQVSATDLDSFKSTLSEVTKDCGGCHQTYRINKT